MLTVRLGIIHLVNARILLRTGSLQEGGQWRRRESGLVLA